MPGQQIPQDAAHEPCQNDHQQRHPIRPGTGAPLAPWMEMILLLTVRATSIERKAPTRFKIADKATATLGLSAPVATDVAIALAVS